MTVALVTGGAGFIGSRLVARLLADGHTVRVLDNFAAGTRENLGAHLDRIELVEADVRDAAAVATAVRGAEWVFHLAAHVSVPDSVARPRHTVSVNVEGTAAVAYAAAAADVERFLFASTCAVYGEPTGAAVAETDATEPGSPYGVSKLMAECLLGQLRRAGRLTTLSCRFFNAYGLGQSGDSPYAGVVPKFIERARAGAPLILHGDGEQTRDLVAVDDLVDFQMRAVRTPLDRWPDVVNVGTGRATSIRELAGLIRDLAGGDLELEFGPSRTGDLRDSCADPNLARERFAWEAQTALADGLRALWEHTTCEHS